MLVKTDVPILNGQKLVQGMQVHKQLMLQIRPHRIAAHHLLCLFVQLAIDKNQWLIKDILLVCVDGETLLLLDIKKPYIPRKRFDGSLDYYKALL